MSPRPGGETDKFGNRYEGVWTVQHLLRVLLGHADSITVEDIDELAQGAEFTFRRRQTVEVHQVKRQNGNANSWTVKSLQQKEIWQNVLDHVEAGRQFHFVSTVPARPVQELADRARRSADVASFINSWLTDGLRAPFDELASREIFGSVEVAWKALRGFWIEWPDERNISDMNAALAELLLEGATGRLAAVGLGDLVQHKLGDHLDAQAIESGLAEYGLQRSQRLRISSLAAQVPFITAGWTAGVERELLRPSIKRSEAEDLLRLLGGEDRLLLLVGDAGDGKSAVLREVVEGLETQDVAALAFRLDRLEPFSSTAELGNRLGLQSSPVTALAAAAGDRRAVLVVDQVDAVSLASGRMPQSFDAVADLVREIGAFKNIRILLACRRFDVENDHRLRELVKEANSPRVEVAKLADAQVSDAVREMGLDPAALTMEQVKLLRSPLHLVLLSTVADDANALSFQTQNNLFDAFWDRKLLECSQRRNGTVRFARVIEILANAMSAQQRLSVHTSVLDHDDLALDAGVLVSEHVLIRDGKQIAFFHEAFFGYVFARTWMGRGQTLSEFLLSGEQELFRRAQVRQVLNHLRESDRERFIAEVEELLTDAAIRFHIKDVVLAILGSLSEPSTSDWDMVSRIIEDHPPFESRIWLSLRTLPWFDRLDSEGLLADWLSDDDEEINNHALGLMLGGVHERPDRLAELLRPFASQPEKFRDWLLWVVRFSDVHRSRTLFELLVEAIRDGKIDAGDRPIWLFTYDLAEHQPAWAVELLEAYLILRPAALALDASGAVAALLDRDHAAIRLVTQAAEGAPGRFCSTLVPYLLTVMKLTERPSKNHLLYDGHFCYRQPSNNFHELEDAILFCTAAALRAFAGQNPQAAKPIFELLATDGHDAAQWLLYEGLRGGAAEHYAAWAVDLLTQSPTRFLSGYISNGVWTARQLIQAIGPHLSPADFARLEGTVLGLRFPWEKRHPGGYLFTLLSGMDEQRLSPTGSRRLGELRRLMEVDQPDEPAPIEMRTVESPISADAARHMTDANWLRAIEKHAVGHEDLGAFEGGSDQLSQVLRAETVRDPERFALFALRLGQDVNPAYTEALLLGLGEAEALPDPTAVFNAIRHFASFNQTRTQRWLGHPLRRYLRSKIPDDIFSILLTLALDQSASSGDSSSTVADQESVDATVYTSGINSSRGSAAQILGDLLVYDVDGDRTARVIPFLNRLADDPSIEVRSCVAHTISASLRHARPSAVEAFAHLIQTDDRLLATHTVQRLIMFLGNGDPSLVVQVITRMLASNLAEVREGGGRLAALAGIEWGLSSFLTSAATHDDIGIRKGAAAACAKLLPRTTNVASADSALRILMNDVSEAVREAAAEVAGELRGSRLRPFSGLLRSLIASDAYPHSVPQLLITLERAPDRVDDLVAVCAERFLEVHGRDISDMSKGAAGDAREVGQLVFRWYAQAATPKARSAPLDLIDQLLLLNAYGVADLATAAER